MSRSPEDGETSAPIPLLPAHGACSAGLSPTSTGFDEVTGTHYSLCPTPGCKWSFTLSSRNNEWTGREVTWYPLSYVNRLS